MSLKLWGSLALTIVGIGGLVLVANVVGTATSVATAPGRVIQQTMGTNNIISNYEWFIQQNQDVIAKDAQLVTARAALADFEVSVGPREQWKFDDRQEWNRLNTVVRGLEGKRADMVAEYNARSGMLNRQIFKDHNLPERLN